ncbi:hypothetical protein [Desulforhopalus sp. IMCC35007]|uniref:hypothetical protein n=1 Tax=Desulforhopalus sp. IMCC35007 TaxID=2569543 RepID=UPI0010ADAA5E|nr:hypothetical protein [Desulforhopalus sp. IMCC35007]TKB08374.1 hypothetical protein FCL48_13645 [Desulforhopalus sp. IMCC35007]
MKLSIFFITELLILATLYVPATAAARLEEVVAEKTYSIYKKACSDSSETNAATKTLIYKLPYIQSRLLRSFCLLQNITSKDIDQFLLELQDITVPFEAAELFDLFIVLPAASAQEYSRLLTLIKDQPHATITMCKNLTSIREIDARQFIIAVEKAVPLPASGQWALSAILATSQTRITDFEQLLENLSQLSETQQWIMEKLVTTSSLKGDIALQTIAALQTLSTSAAINVMALLKSTILPADQTLHWLHKFFLLPTKEQEQIFSAFELQDKLSLLRIYGEGTINLIHEINRFHDITDGFGREISKTTLKSFSEKQLHELFARLHPEVKIQWSEPYNDAVQANNFTELSRILHQATQQSQQETVVELTSANLYVLLARGTQLYTSSFRNVLVPHFKKRLQDKNKGNLLYFLQNTDPTSIYTSSFITNLARRGQLAMFMPAENLKQFQLLDLVVKSAYASQSKVLHFSASFPELFATLQPQARSYFIEKTLEILQQDLPIRSDLIQLILQHYMAQKMIAPTDYQKIAAVIEKRGVIDTTPLNRVPFQDWLRDGRLSSLSIFQDDDDGYTSYISNNMALLHNGYAPGLSFEFSGENLSIATTDTIEKLLGNMGAKPYEALNQLFHLSSKSPIVIDWKKTVSKVEITHSTGIFQDNIRQLGLLQKFWDLGYEMYCQRGHSYWVGPQLQIPMESLKLDTALAKNKTLPEQHFLSLGSCGGMESYLELSQIFAGQVDILATVGTGKVTINNQYNRILFELAASHPHLSSWNEVAQLTRPIFTETGGSDYLQPGSLPALLHKMIFQLQHHDDH